MNALVYHGPGDVRLEQRPDPVPGLGDVLIKVKACGICGTDLRIMRGKHRAFPPGTVRIPGHEIAGTVVNVADNVLLSRGDAVFVAPNLRCGQCRACVMGRSNLCSALRAIGITQDGGFAELLVISADVVAEGNLLRLDMPVDFGALTLVEPLACVVRSLDACPVHEGDVVVIIGGGPIGLLHVLLARLNKPRAIVLSDRHANRRDKASELGADVVIDPETESLVEAARSASEGRGADVVVVAAPSAAAQQEAIALAAVGGRVNFFAGLSTESGPVPIDTNALHYKELKVTGTTGNTVEDCRTALRLFQSGSVETASLITARFPLGCFHAGLDAARSGENIKVVLEG